MAELLGQRSGTAWAVWTGVHKNRAILARRQSLLAATSSLKETSHQKQMSMLPVRSLIRSAE